MTASALLADAPPPIDIAHLDRQTMGDAALRAEVLALYATQISELSTALEAAADRPGIAHTIKGASRGIGAFAVADAAERLEHRPSDTALVAALRDQIALALDHAGQLAAAPMR